MERRFACGPYLAAMMSANSSFHNDYTRMLEPLCAKGCRVDVPKFHNWAAIAAISDSDKGE